MNAVFETHRDSDTNISCFYAKRGYYLHFHSNVEIFYSLSDDKTVTLKDETFPLKKGWYYIADSYDIHSNTGDGEYICLIIPTRYLEKFNKIKKGFKLKDNFFFDKTGKIKKILDYLLTPEYKNELILQGYVDIILGEILSETKFVLNTEGSVNEIARAIIVYVNENYSKNITLDSLANTFGYSKTHLSNIINDCLKVNLTGYLNRIRLEKFIEKMNETENRKKLTAIAFDCGYESLQTFYRNFKKYYGCTPNEFFKK